MNLLKPTLKPTLKLSGKVRIQPGNKNEPQWEKWPVNNKMRIQTAKHGNFGFVQIKPNTVEARVNHQET